jgi:hypothetical protein
MLRSLIMSATAGILLASCASAAIAANPLMGRWHLSSWQPNTNPNWVGPVCTVTDIVFTPTSTTSYDPKANPALPVTYNVQPGKVVVSGGNDVIYYLVDANHIRRDDMGKCVYQRAG